MTPGTYDLFAAPLGRVKPNAGDNPLISALSANENAADYMMGVDKLKFKYIGE